MEEADFYHVQVHTVGWLRGRGWAFGGLLTCTSCIKPVCPQHPSYLHPEMKKLGSERLTHSPKLPLREVAGSGQSLPRRCAKVSF